MTATTTDARPLLETPPAEEPPGLPAARAFGDRLARLLRPLRVFEALRWGKDVEEAFFAKGCRELPPVDRDTYLRRPLPFLPDASHLALADLSVEITRQLGTAHPAGRLLLRRCAQGHEVIDLLEARGTPEFTDISGRLYGRSRDPLPAGACTLRQFAAPLGECAAGLEDDGLSREDRPLTAEACAHLLAERLGAYFGQPVPVLVTEALDATAAVCGGWLKVRRDARFNLRDVRLLEVHEGWVHLGTSRCARGHALGAILGRSLPGAAATQEGLAVWTEVLTFASHPPRLRQLCGRVEAVAMAEEGADFLEVFRYFRAGGSEPREAYQQAARVFRGGLPSGVPFTKDLVYARGFAEVGHFLGEAVAQRRMKQIPLLFCGKVSLTDLPDLAELVDTGLIDSPRLVPPPFADPRALAAWLCCVAAGLRTPMS